jgi:hypothetical protein
MFIFMRFVFAIEICGIKTEAKGITDDLNMLPFMSPVQEIGYPAFSEIKRGNTMSRRLRKRHKKYISVFTR